MKYTRINRAVESINRSFSSALLPLGVFCFSAAAMHSDAAVVTIDSPAIGGANTYNVAGTDYDIYQFDTPDGVIVDPASNGGVEFILLGAHETIVHESNSVSNGCSTAPGTPPESLCNSTVSVDVNNMSGTSTTGGVSLILTAAESLIWDVNIEDGVDVQSIFVFGSTPQTVNFVGGSLAAPIFVGESECAFAYLGDYDAAGADDALGGCRTDDLLGIASSNNFLGLTNFLAEETDLELTSFNGTYFADGFTVDIDTTAIPVPGAFWLMASALAGLALRRSAANS